MNINITNVVCLANLESSSLNQNSSPAGRRQVRVRPVSMERVLIIPTPHDRPIGLDFPLLYDTKYY